MGCGASRPTALRGFAAFQKPTASADSEATSQDYVAGSELAENDAPAPPRKASRVGSLGGMRSKRKTSNKLGRTHSSELLRTFVEAGIRESRLDHDEPGCSTQRAKSEMTEDSALQHGHIRLAP
eukprot:6763409-Prymnesium_polylepis.1